METTEAAHAQIIRQQFTQQAVPFTQLQGHLDSVQLLVEMSGVGAGDAVLDVACGPGIVACEFAQVAHRVSGIDLTDKMIEEARKRQRVLERPNMDWTVGRADALPYADATFDVVLSRYTFHHFMQPAAVLAEMCRVCRPGGCVVIADPVLPQAQVDAYNQMERLRDPSHTQALSVEAFDAMIQASGLRDVRRAGYAVEMELEAQLAASFPHPGDADRIREMFERDLNTNAMGVGAHRVDGAIHFSYPISVYAGTKA